MRLRHSLSWIRRLGRKKRLGARRRPRRPPFVSSKPRIESLEERAVPTILFAPVFANASGTAETLLPPPKGQHYLTMSNARVNLIFWGPFWGTSLGKQDAELLNSDANDILSSPYLSKLGQYGSNGVATLTGNPDIDAGDPIPRGFNAGDPASVGTVQKEIARAIADPNSPTLSPDKNATRATAQIYAVITDPAFSGGDGGYNLWSTYTYPDGTLAFINLISVGTSPQSATSNLADRYAFDTTFSHEVAERMSDPTGDTNGITVNPSPLLPQNIARGGSGQIADYDPDSGHRYASRVEPGRVDVQAYWSAADNAFVVADGNSQSLTLTPKWNVTLINPQLPAIPSNENETFSGTYSLAINGDQFGPNTPDQLTILSDVTQTKITLNGETFDFDPNVLSSINVSLGGGNDTVNVNETVVPITINDAPNVNIGLGTAYLVKAGVRIQSPNVLTALTVDDSADRSAPTIEANPDSVQLFNGGSPLSSVQFDPTRLRSLSLKGGPGGPVFNMLLAYNPTLQLPQHISVSGGGGASVLMVDPEASLGNTFTITKSSVTASRFTLTGSRLVNQINYSALGKLEVAGNRNGSVFLVQNTAAGTPVELVGSGPDSPNPPGNLFHIGSPTSSLSDIQSTLTIQGFSSNDMVTLDDTEPTTVLGTSIRFSVSGDPVKGTTTVTRQASYTVGTHPQTFNSTFMVLGVGSIDILGSNARSGFVVQGTAPFVPVAITAGSGPSSFQVGDATHALDSSLLAKVALTGNGKDSSVVFDDVASTTAEADDIYTDHLDHGPSGGASGNPIYYSNLTGISLYTGAGGTVGNGVAVHGSAANTPVTVYGHPGVQEEFGANSLGFDGQNVPFLAPVAFHGADPFSFGFYLDNSGNTHQNYTLSVNPAQPTRQLVQKSGESMVSFDGIDAVILYTSGGDNPINVRGVAPGVSVVVGGSNGDVMTVGSLAPAWAAAWTLSRARSPSAMRDRIEPHWSWTILATPRDRT